MLKNIVIVQDFATINGGNAKVALTSAIYLKKQGYRPHNQNAAEYQCVRSYNKPRAALQNDEQSLCGRKAEISEKTDR